MDKQERLEYHYSCGKNRTTLFHQNNRLGDFAFMDIDVMHRAMMHTKHREEFETFDRKSLPKMNDKVLAIWQSQHDSDEPQWRLAEHEWQRRITVEQLKAARWQAYFGIAGVIIGVILTRLLEFLK